MHGVWFQVSVKGSKGQDIWDSCCLSGGFQSVRIRRYTSNTSSVCLARTPAQGYTLPHTYQINTDLDDDTEMLNARPRAFSICLSSLQSLFSSYYLSTPFSSLPFSLGWPPSAIFSSSSPPWSIVSPPLVSSAASYPRPLLFLCSPAVPSLLIVPVKQLADVTFNYGGISSGAVEAEQT